MERIESNRQTRIYNSNTRKYLSIYGIVSRTWAFKSHNNSTYHYDSKRNGYNKYFHTIKKICLILAASVIATPANAADVGGVSATANPIANSSGSVTNQAIQVLQGPYITNTYGGGIQCQGATMNITPYVTGTGNFRRPFEHTFQDPVYEIHDANDDGQIDNPGNVLYYMPTRTNQTDNYNLSLGVSATWSKPLDKTLQELCKQAAITQTAVNNQLLSNKRLDFELARLKNCGELMKAGIMFHPKSPYHKVCADVVLVNPVGVVANHSHGIQPNSTSSSSSVPESPESVPVVDPSVPEEKVEPSAPSQGFFGWFRLPFLSPASSPSSEDQPAALLGGPIQLPPLKSQPSAKQSAE